MKILFGILIILPIQLLSQAYWQQEVHYTIHVKLDDKKHQLSGNERFDYINRSPETLSKIYIHLWPNAYKGKHSALAKQQYLQNEDLLIYGEDRLKGWIDSLDFRVNGEVVKWYFESEHEDICIVELKNPLPPEGKVTISTPFRVQIPSGEISRLGHVGESYQITQWYPKPAVFDKNGWHPMPYLNQGEFYSEYGSFDVSITLPKNYVVGATGDLQTESERKFLDSLSAATQGILNDSSSVKNEFPASSTEQKTIRFFQENVHDFAWFADKRYLVLKGQVSLPHSQRVVTTWALFTPQNKKWWKNSIEYLNDATYYYSLWNGDYPYQQVTAVDGTISAGGGMEYPTITVIGNANSAYELEVVIVHEVGHNWFYGQLGTNERVHGWMDEGLNTLNEIRYMQTKYPDNTALSDMVLGGKFHFNDLSHHDLSDISYRMVAALGEDQPIETHSAHFSPANYGVVMYQKTGLVFFYLKDYLGEELFDRCMQEYYRTWEFKHPQPEDFKRSLEQTSGKNLDWFFHDLIQTTHHIDYKIVSVKRTKNGYLVKTKNRGGVDGPIEINGLIDDSLVVTQWIEPGNKKNTLQLASPSLDVITIDHGKEIPEIYRQNNTWTAERLFHRWEKPSFEFLIGDNEQDRTSIFWTPTIAGNAYDKLMLGIGIHNYGVPPNRLNYLVMPFYSFGRNMISGISEVSTTLLPQKHLKVSRFGFSVKSFKHDSTYAHNNSYYIALSPYWFAKIGNRKLNRPYTQNIRIQSTYKKDKIGPTHTEHAGFFVAYNFNYTHPDHRLHVHLRHDYMTNVNTIDEIARGQIEATYSYRYKKRGREAWLELRLFGGKQYYNRFAAFTSRYPYAMSLSGSDGTQDLFVEEYFFARTNRIGTNHWAQQRTENMGGFKSVSTYGTTTNALAAANIYVQLPVLMGVFGVYGDFGTFWDDQNVARSAINTGIGVRLGKIAGIYFPVWMSQEFDASLSSLSYWEKVRFTLQFNLINKPLNLSTLL